MELREMTLGKRGGRRLYLLVPPQRARGEPDAPRWIACGPRDNHAYPILAVFHEDDTARAWLRARFTDGYKEVDWLGHAVRNGAHKEG